MILLWGYRYSRALMMLSIGDLVLDITILTKGQLRVDDDNPASITLGGGGQAANFCAWASRLGETTRLVTRVGDDDGGHLLVAELERVGVDVHAIWAAQPTGVVAVLVSPNGERTMATQRGACIGLRPDDLREAWFEDVKLIHVPAYSLFEDPLAEAARAAIAFVRRGGGLLAIDLSSAAGIHEYGPARMAHVLKDLAPDLLFATSAEADALGIRLERLAAVSVVKLGASGCTVLGEFIPSPPVEEIDATGAGDALAAAFCSSYLRAANPIEAARYAVAVASGAVTHIGARPGIGP
ncbi:MAG TPA: PfkB family carbohydrate kinase [Candidatus Dormibacteraeota bacterium]